MPRRQQDQAGQPGDGGVWWLGLLLLLLLLMSATAWQQRPTEPAFHRVHQCQWSRQRRTVTAVDDPIDPDDGEDEDPPTRMAPTGR